MKRCPRCKLSKPLTDFPKNKSNKDGFHSYCFPCSRAASATYRLNNLEKMRARDRARRDPIKAKACRKASLAADPDYDRRHDLKRHFNMTIEQYDAMSEKQNHVCAICDKPETAKHANGKVRRLAVHHNHDTGNVIALLCARCNRALGAFDDDPALLRRAAKLATRKGVAL